MRNGFKNFSTELAAISSVDVREKRMFGLVAFLAVLRRIGQNTHSVLFV